MKSPLSLISIVLITALSVFGFLLAYGGHYDRATFYIAMAIMVRGI